MLTNDPSPPPIQPPIAPAATHEQSSIQPPATKVNAWWDVFVAFMVWFGSVVLLVFLPVVVVIPYFVYVTLTSGAPGPELLSHDKTFLFLSILAVIPAHGLTLLGIWMIVSRWGRVNFSSALKLSWPPSWASWQGVAICFAISIFLLGLGAVLTKFLGGGKTDLDTLIESSFRARLATAFLAVATAPLVEEIIYRGILYPALQRLLGMGWAVLVVTVIFAGVHVPQYKNNIGVIVVITVLSVVLTLIRAWTDRLLPSVVIHIIFNGLQSLYLVLEPFVQKPEKIEPAPTLIVLYKVIRHLF